MSIFDDGSDVSTYEAEMQDRWEPQATMADAHREWHLNSGVPMGTPGCPQDACHPVDDDYWQAEAEQDHWEQDAAYAALYFEPDPYAGTGFDDDIPF